MDEKIGELTTTLTKISNQHTLRGNGGITSQRLLVASYN
jgi:hypothetical protein